MERIKSTIDNFIINYIWVINNTQSPLKQFQDLLGQINIQKSVENFIIITDFLNEKYKTIENKLIIDLNLRYCFNDIIMCTIKYFDANKNIIDAMLSEKTYEIGFNLLLYYNSDNIIQYICKLKNVSYALYLMYKLNIFPSYLQDFVKLLGSIDLIEDKKMCIIYYLQSKTPESHDQLHDTFSDLVLEYYNNKILTFDDKEFVRYVIYQIINNMNDKYIELLNNAESSKRLEILRLIFIGIPKNKRISRLSYTNVEPPLWRTIVEKMK